MLWIWVFNFYIVHMRIVTMKRPTKTYVWTVPTYGCPYVPTDKAFSKGRFVPQYPTTQSIQKDQNKDLFRSHLKILNKLLLDRESRAVNSENAFREFFSI